ncbi:MAG: NAD(P)/FAD-dependent oxidoreductase [Peptococcaceae bacterium]|nr:MAG: NAD(P)/FAD-dependent oxidoreductase [Peptococcaceae bacterium]
MQYDVIVVGGGPVGCAVGRDIAAAGRRVLILEEHSRPGEPLQCAGLISTRTFSLSGVSRQVIQHRLKGVRLYSPAGQLMDLAGERVYALAVDRVAFDRDLAGQAVAAGAEMVPSARVTALAHVPGGVRAQVRRDGGSEVFTGRLVVGADGHNSLVARWLGLPPPLEKVPMYSAEVELEEQAQSLMTVFLGRNLAPGWFGWIIPLGAGRARVGLGAADRTASGKCNLRLLFNELTEQYPRLFRGMKIVRSTGGVVPLGWRERTYGPYAMLAGDAACHVKPISGGGLFLGLTAARCCAGTALRALDAEDYSEQFLSSYQQAWEAQIGGEIKCGLHHRQIFLDLSDREMDCLIGFFNKPYWRRLVLKHGDIDYHSRLAGKLSGAPPWARRFVTGGLKKLLCCCAAVSKS